MARSFNDILADVKKNPEKYTVNYSPKTNHSREYENNYKAESFDELVKDVNRNPDKYKTDSKQTTSIATDYANSKNSQMSRSAISSKTNAIAGGQSKFVPSNATKTEPLKPTNSTINEPKVVKSVNGSTAKTNVEEPKTTGEKVKDIAVLNASQYSDYRSAKAKMEAAEANTRNYDAIKDYEKFAEKRKSMSKDELELLDAIYAASHSNDTSNAEGRMREQLKSLGYTDDEITRYSIYNKRYNNQKDSELWRESAKEYADEHPYLSSASSILPSVFGGVMGIADKASQLSDIASLKESGITPTFDTNGKLNYASQYSDAIRNRFMETHNDWTVSAGDRDFDVGDFVYSTAMSGLDSVTAMLVGDVAGAGLSALGMGETAVSLGKLGDIDFGVGSNLLGLGAANQTFNDTIDKGGSMSQAITSATLAGIAETFFEGVSIGNLKTFSKLESMPVDSVKAFVKKSLGSAFTNATEEGLTEVANITSDYLINGGVSDFYISWQNYINAGYPEDEAKSLAIKDIVYRIAEAAAGGALMGLGFGIGGGAMNAAQNAISDSYTGKQISKNGNPSGLLENIKETATEKKLSELADKYAARIAEGKKVSNRQLGAIERKSVESTMNAEMESASFDEILQGVSSNERNASQNREMAKIVQRYLDGETVSKNEENIIKTDPTISDYIQSRESAESEFNDQKKVKALNTIMAGAVKEKESEIKSSGTENNVVSGKNAESIKIADIKRTGTNKGENVSITVEATVDGEKVSVPIEEVEFANSKAADVVNLVAGSTDLDTQTANYILKAAPMVKGSSATIIAHYMNYAYTAGRYNLSEDYIPTDATTILGKDIVEHLYKSGQNAKATLAESEIAKNVVKGKKVKNADVIRYEGKEMGVKRIEKDKTLTNVQKGSMIRGIALQKALGIEAVFYKSKKNADGKFVATIDGKEVVDALNGMYKNGKIYIDVNAGSLGEGTMLFTMSHELTHFIKQWSPAQFRKLADYVLPIVHTDTDINRLIDNEIEKSKKTSNPLTREVAEEEIVANALETMLSDDKDTVINNLIGLKNEDEGLFRKIVSKISKWADEIHRFYNEMLENGRLTSAGRAVAEMADDIDGLRDMFTEALKDAGKNFQSATVTQITDTLESAKDADGSPLFQYRAMEADAKYSIRDTEYLELAKDPVKNEAKLNEMVKQAALESIKNIAKGSDGKPLDLYHGTRWFGWTEYKERNPDYPAPFIYTSTDRSVSANYAGDNHYAAVRDIGKKYREGTSIDDILANAESVYGQKWRRVTEEDIKNAYNRLSKEADSLADKLNELWNNVNFNDMTDEEANALSGMADVVWDFSGQDFNDESERKALIKYLRPDVERFERRRELINNYYANNRNSLGNNEKRLLSFITGYDIGDFKIDVEYGLLPAFSEPNAYSLFDFERESVPVISENGDGSITTTDKLYWGLEERKNIGSYHLYGDLGERPFIFDANGAYFTDLKVPEIDDDYHSTDYVAKWAYDNGYTSVIMKNIYDYGNKADNYVFFSPSQIKSADPVTYDDSGNIVPLSERFNEKNDDIRYSTRVDNDYLSAVESGDMKTAQNMVDKAAEAGGFVEEAFHGSRRFGWTKPSVKNSRLGTALFVSDSYANAGEYAYSGWNEEGDGEARTIASARNYKPLEYDASTKEILNAIKSLKNNELGGKYNNAREVPASALIEANRDDIDEVIDSINKFTSYWSENTISKHLGKKDIIEDALQSNDIQKWEKLYNARSELYLYVDAYQVDSQWGDIVGKAISLAQKIVGGGIELENGNVVPVSEALKEYNDVAYADGKGVYRFYAKPGKQYVYNGAFNNFDSLKIPSEAAEWIKENYGDEKVTDTDTLAAWAKSQGYDSIKFYNIYDNVTSSSNDGAANVTAFFYPESQIKSADPVTYDDNGNVIPPSERFNEDNSDIRFSVRDSLNAPSDIYAFYNNKIDESREMTMILNNLGENYASMLGKVVPDDKQIRKLTSEIIKQYNSKIDAKYLNDRIRAAFDYMANTNILDWSQDIIPYLGQIGKEVLEQSAEVDDSLYNAYFRKWLKKTTLKVSDKDISERYKTFNEMRKSFFGKVNLSQTKGIPIDSLWNDMVNASDGYLPVQGAEGKDRDGDVVAANSTQNMFRILDGYFENTKKKVVNPYTKGTYDIDAVSINIGLDLYRKYWDVARHETPESRFANQMNRGYAELKDAKQKLHEEIERQKKEVISNSKKTLKQEIQSYRDTRENTRRRQVSKNDIERKVRYLQTRYEQKTNAKHIPKKYDELVSVMLKALPFDAPSMGGVVINSGRIAEMCNTYRVASEAKGSAIGGMVEENISNLNSVAKNIDNNQIPFSRLSLSDYEAIGAVVDHIKFLVDNENKLFGENKKETIDAVSTRIRNEFYENSELLKSKGKRVARDKGSNFFSKMLKPECLFEESGSETLYKQYVAIRNGENKQGEILYKFRKYAQEQKAKYSYDPRWKDRIINNGDGIKNDRGQVMNLTIEEAMSVYALSNRPQGLQHLLGGGIQIKREGKSTVPFKKITDTIDFRLTENDIQKIVNTLTSAQKQYADALVEYMSKDIAKDRNEVTMAIMGIEKYVENYYFPIESSKDAIADNVQRSERNSSVSNVGSSKTLNKNAMNKVIVNGFTDTVNNHIAESAVYCGFAVESENINRLWNSQTDDETKLLKSVIQENIGDARTRAMKQFMVDLNSGAAKANNLKFAEQFTSKMKKASVMANISVIVQQPTAVFRAMLYVDPKNFATTIHKADTEEMYRLNGCAMMKQIGYFDVNLGRTVTNWLDEYSVDKATKKDYSLAERWKQFNENGTLDELAGWGAEKADEVTWTLIWNACKKQCKGDLNKACELFQDTISKTQVYDSIFTKCELMRQKDLGSQMISAFMSEPVTSLNMLSKAIQDKSAGKVGGTVVARALTCYLGSLISNAMLKSLVQILRDDDDEKEFLVKYLTNIADNIAGDIFGMIPYLNSLYSILQGFSVERMDTEFFNAIVDGAKTIITEATSLTPDYEKMLSKALMGISQGVGIPVYNLYRDIKSIFVKGKKVLSGDKKTDNEKESPSNLPKEIAESIVDNFDFFNIGGKKINGKIKKYVAGDYSLRNEILDMADTSEITKSIGELYKGGRITQSTAKHALINLSYAKYEGDKNKRADSTIKGWDEKAKENGK